MSKRQSRLITGGILFFLFILVFCGNLVFLQVVKGEEYATLAREDPSNTEAVSVARGQILDRNGRLLVSDQICWNVTLEPGQMGELRDESLRSLFALCQKHGVSWRDSLPVSKTAPYHYTKDQVSASELESYQQYRKAIGLIEPGKARDLLEKLGERFSIPKSISPQTKRFFAGVLYEAALREEGILWTNAPCLEEVDLVFFTELRNLSLPGVRISQTSKRTYHTTAAAHLLGHMGQISQEQWSRYQDQGYSMNELVGKGGIEELFESYLHGEEGLRVLPENGEPTPEEGTYLREPKPGDTVSLTLDLALQEKTEEVLANTVPSLGNAEGAAAAILDVRDGSILTLASYPSFDLSTFSEDYASLQQDPLRPLFHRGLQGLYAPGSTFKMVTAIAALEEGVITPQTMLLDSGKSTYYAYPQPSCLIYRQRGETHGLLNVSEALAVSCNVFFFDIGRQLGISLLNDYSHRFGLGEHSGVELPGEETGIVAGPEYTASLGETWYEGSVLSAAIGQENHRFTPLQLASYLSTLVNGGTRWKAHLLKEIRSGVDQSLLSSSSPEKLGSVSMAPEHLDAVKTGMLALTESGSVSAAFQDLTLSVGAKTGSVQVSGSEDANAVFVCFAPYDEPEIAMAIVVEKGGSGSDLGEIAAEILRCYEALR